MSPIKGLTEQRRLPRLGKIHLGVKAKNEKGVEYPKAVDYFVCPPEVQNVFGEKPKTLRILIPVEDEEKWASQYYRCYSRTRGLVCKGDGEKCIRLVDAKTGDLAWKDEATVTAMKEMTCAGRECPDYGKKCKEIMNLQFLLPEVPGLGVWQIDTGSVNSIRNINSASELVKRLYGHVSLIPLLLTVEPQEVKIPQTNKRKTVWILNLRAKDTLGGLMQLATRPPAELLSLPSPEEAELPIPDDDTPELIIPAAQAPPGEEPSATKAQAHAVQEPVASTGGGGSPVPQTSHGHPVASQGQRTWDDWGKCWADVQTEMKGVKGYYQMWLELAQKLLNKPVMSYTDFQRFGGTMQQAWELAQKVAQTGQQKTDV